MRKTNLCISLLLTLTSIACAQNNEQVNHASQKKRIDLDDSITAGFNPMIKDFKKKLIKVLPPLEQTLLKKVKVKLDTTYFGLELSSSSDERTITYNWGIFKTFNRDQIAYAISNGDKMPKIDMLGVFEYEFNLPNFYRLYSTYLSRINNDINVKEQAELNEDDLDLLEDLEMSQPFRWIYKRRMVFAFLHEFYHQIQNYDQLKIKIDDSKLSQNQKNSKLLQLEIDADAYAYRITSKIGIIPVNYVEVVHLFGLFRENKLQTETELNKRKQAYISLLAKRCSGDLKKIGYDCNAITKEVYYSKLDIIREIALFNKQKQAYKARNEIKKKDSIEAIVEIANVFLYRNQLAIKNLDSAFYYYSKASEIGEKIYPKIDSTKYTRAMIIYEFSSLLSGKILELNNHDYANSIKYYQRSRRISRYMPIEFYDKLISRLSLKQAEKLH